MKNSRSIGVIAAFLLSTFAYAAGKPNVLFIAIDDLNACIDGMNGETSVPTPNLSRLAKKGILFTNAHCAAPSCGPSRASVMTGIAPATSGVYYNTQDWRVNTILKDRVTLPMQFKNNGYVVRGAGKLYHAASLSKHGYEGLIDPRPWDEYFPSKKQQMPFEVTPDSFPVNGNKKFYGGYFDWAQMDIETDDMADAKVVNWAINHLSQKQDKPLFLGVGIYRPHIPWWTPKKYFDQHPIENVELPEVVENDMDDVPEAGYNLTKHTWHKWMVENNKWKEAVQAYNASVSFADEMVGRLLDALENGPNADNTIIVLWADNGYHLGQKQHWEKFALWEQTTRIPFMISVPNKFKKGKTCEEAVSLLDIFPTLIELCELPEVEGLDGETLIPLLQKPKQKTNRAVVCTHGLNNHAVRSDKWRYIKYADGSEELYDQKKDPKNFTNLASNKKYDPIKKELAQWLPKNNAAKDPTYNYNAQFKKKK